MLEDRSADEVRYAQFLAAIAPLATLREVVEMLLAQEIARQSWTGRYWVNRGAIARSDLADAGKWKGSITPDPLRAILESLVQIVDRAEELAPSAQT